MEPHNRTAMAKVESEVEAEVESAAEKALVSREINMPDSGTTALNVYAAEAK